MKRGRSRPNPRRGAKKKLLNEEQMAAARAAWARGSSISEVAAEIGVSVDVMLVRLRDQLADLEPRKAGSNSSRRPVDPTEEEIYGVLTLIEQRSWDDEERSKRWVGNR